MPIKRFARADLLRGRILIAAKSLVDIVLMLIRTPSIQSIRLAHLILRVKPQYTMVTNANLVNLYEIVGKANALNISGDLVECGVWNGGSAAIMALACREDSGWFQRRKLWLFDSFAGLPEPSERDGRLARELFSNGWCKGSVEKVMDVFAKLDIPLDNVKVVPGWFETTVPGASLSKIAVLHIDADWYDSVKLVLEALYDKVAPGGFVVLDDYGYWPGCQKAMNDYLAERRIEGVYIVETQGDGAYFQKP